MKTNLFSRIKNNPLVKGSFILFIGSLVVNISNYLFHFFMGRMLGPSDYGVLVSLVSLLYLVSVFSTTLTTITIKFTADYFSAGQFGKIHLLIKKLAKRFFWVGLAVFFIFLLTAKFIAKFLQINHPSLIIIIGAFSLILFLISINRGVIQGLQKFGHLAVNVSVEGLLKLILAIIFVVLGWKVFGPVAAILVACLFAYLISFVPISFLFKKKFQSIDKKKFILYSLPTLFIIFFSVSLYNSDIILVKHFFPSREAGLYSALSTLGKIVFFASGAIAQAMFPMTAYLTRRKKDPSKILKQTIILSSLISLVVLILYFIFPKYLVTILFGKEYLEISSYLFYFGLVFFIFSLSNIFISFYLSIHKLRFVYFLALVALLEIILIAFFHQSIMQIIFILFSIMVLLLAGLIIYYRSLALCLKKG